MLLLGRQIPHGMKQLIAQSCAQSYIALLAMCNILLLLVAACPPMKLTWPGFAMFVTLSCAWPMTQCEVEPVPQSPFLWIERVV